uniref:Uncharacterized protein n=1 Tax=Romanomermis culicivorax TaxID=13658 RepID=A0A915ISE0_ROMCU
MFSITAETTDVDRDNLGRYEDRIWLQEIISIEVDGEQIFEKIENGKRCAEPTTSSDARVVALSIVASWHSKLLNCSEHHIEFRKPQERQDNRFFFLNDYNIKRVVPVHELDQWFKATFGYQGTNPGRHLESQPATGICLRSFDHQRTSSLWI